MAVSVGSKQLTFSNEHHPTPFSFRMIYNKEGRIKLTLSLKNTRTSAKEGLEGIDFFRELEKGGSLIVEMLNRPN